ncbi:MAG: hypothetical protein AAGD38_15815 [Acidobacteriota bacterium]
MLLDEISVGIAIVVTVALLLHESIRGPGGDSRHRASRLLVTGLVGLGLVLMSIRIDVSLDTDEEGQVFLVSERGSSPLDPSMPVYAVGSSSPPPGARVAGDLATVLRNEPDLDSLHISGDGLAGWQWRALGSRVRVSRSDPPPTLEPGIVKIDWARRIELGDSLRVEGLLAQNGHGGTLELVGPAGVEAVFDVPTNDPIESFALTSTPKSAGRWLYELRWRYGENEVRTPLGVVVDRPTVLRVLWLEGAPRFETRFVVDHLLDRASTGLDIRFAIRSMLTRDRFRMAFHGLDTIDLDTLTADLLRGFDMVVVDGESLSVLRDAERTELRRAIEEEGSSLLVVPSRGIDSAFTDSLVPFTADPIPGFVDYQARLRLDRERTSSALSLPPSELSRRPGHTPLAVDPSGRVLAARTTRGRGTVAVSLVANSHRWLREGQPEPFAVLWARLLESSRGNTTTRWVVPNGPILTDHPLEIAIVTATPEPELLFRDASGESWRVPLEQSQVETDRWYGVVWPRAHGWSELRLVSQDGPMVRDVHVDESKAWRAYRQYDRQQATRAATLGVRETATDDTTDEKVSTVPTERRFSRRLRLVGFLLTVLGLSLLWLDERRVFG